MKNVFLLHGFLGLASDWDLFVGHFLKALNFERQNIRINKINLYNEFDLMDFKNWAHRFNQNSSFRESEQNFLIGYSLGGRLAMEIFLSNPKNWAGVHLISSQFGLKTSSERLHRLKNDQRWAERFSTEPLSKVFVDWNQQPIFVGSVEPERFEKNYDRKKLAWILQHWSLAKHENLFELLYNWSQTDLKQGRHRLNWYCGERDLKYIHLKKIIDSECPFISTTIIPESGHRILFDQTQRLAEVISQSFTN